MHSPLRLIGAFLLLLPISAIASPALSWRNPASLANPLPSLGAVLLSPSCTAPIRKRDLAFPDAPPASILVVSAPPLSQEQAASVQDVRSAEVLEEADDEALLVGALGERMRCGAEVRVVEVADLHDVLDDNSDLNTALAASFSYTLLASLSPASLLFLASPAPSTFASRKERVASLIRGATSGPSGILIACAWVLGLLFIARRVYSNRRAAARDRREQEREQGEGGEGEALLYARGSFSEMQELV